MTTYNSINSIALDKLLKKYNLTPNKKYQVVILIQWKKASWTFLHRLSRILKLKQLVLDHQQQ